MSNLEPRSGKRLTRKQRETRAFQLVVAGGALSAVAAVGFLLAALNVVGFGIPLLAAILAVVCVVLFRRNTGL